MFKFARFSLLATAWLPLMAQTAATQTTTPGTVPNVHHLMGLDKVPRNAQGNLIVEKDSMRFDSKKGGATVPVNTIDDVYTGAEVSQSGGTVGTITKVALPYGGGRALSLLLRNKIDILTITYRDANGGFHGFISTLPKGQGDQLRTQLVTAGAHVSPPAELQKRMEGKQDKPDPPPPARPKEDSKKLPKLTGSAIRIEQIDAGDVLIPMEFRVAIYESLIERVRQSGAFQQVFRSGDRQADSVADLVTLRTKVDRFQEGSRTKREVTTIAGATKVDVSATLAAKDGRVILDQTLTGKVRFFGDNLGATNDLAKHIAKLLRERF
jgi:hypothetical protein